MRRCRSLVSRSLTRTHMLQFIKLVPLCSSSGMSVVPIGLTVIGREVIYDGGGESGKEGGGDGGGDDVGICLECRGEEIGGEVGEVWYARRAYDCGGSGRLLIRLGWWSQGGFRRPA